MIRNTSAAITALATLITMTGCQSLYRTPTSPPARLDARLAAIEQARLAPAGPLDDARGAIPYVSRLNAPRCRSVAQGGFVRANRPPPASCDQAATRAHKLARGVHSHMPQGNPPTKVGGSWALTDLGDEAVEDGSQGETEFLDYGVEREEKYLRRPPLDSFWETVKRDIRHMPGDLWRDTKRVYANPTNLIILGTAYGGSLALQETGPDDTVEDRYRDGHHTFSKDWRDAFGAAGNPGTHFALAGLWYLIGQQGGDEKTYEVGKTMFSALIINGLTTMVGQAASWDRSPNGEWGTFPSGHTSSSFCMASVLHEAYGHAVGVPLYGLATLVAMERIDSSEHYFSDVMMGAVVGTVIGHSVASGRDPEFFGWKVLPYASPNGGSGIAFVKTLP